jgi:hypothetical protein
MTDRLVAGTPQQIADQIKRKGLDIGVDGVAAPTSGVAHQPPGWRIPHQFARRPGKPRLPLRG